MSNLITLITEAESREALARIAISDEWMKADRVEKAIASQFMGTKGFEIDITELRGRIVRLELQLKNRE